MGQWRRKRGRNLDGILVLDKAQGKSSNGCLQELKRLFEAEKAGHTGSLDPLATGVLPICFGEATKISQFLLDSDKGYRTKIQLGVRTDSADCQGEVIERRCADAVEREDIVKALEAFRGEIQQVPPMYSALKHQGKPLYKLAREGVEVERKARDVTIYSIELVSFSSQDKTLELEVSCSKGTYIRTIADDLGEALGCGGHVVELRRLKAGPFCEAQSVSLEKLLAVKEADGLEGLDAYLLGADTAVEALPEVNLPNDTAAFVKQGQAVIVRHLPESGLVRLYDEESFLGIGAVLDDGRVAPKRLFVSR
ncbi:MAG: tRNA pseudouridine(55) synthase TruB [Pseudohongiellaceae bacterium]|nr:tRNA pseudouridine(55) synthase TruB [Pseudohongiellaceae bacterium]